MNRRQKLVQQQFLNNEKAIIGRLEQVYGQALKDIDANIEKLMKRFDPETGDLPQSAVYQLKYQKMLRGQVEGILSRMQDSQYVNVSDYLNECYEDGFIGGLFDLHGQGVPLTMPINQESLVRAVQLDSKISEGLYSRLGEDVGLLKKKILAQVSRSIATNTSFTQTAKLLERQTRIGYSRAIRIARTEGHRIQNQAIMDSAHDAKERGADLVKQWDATLDGKTRDSHVAVDGEIRELDEKFSNGLEYPGDPAGGAAEVVNCRCVMLQRARWALGGSFTKMNSFTGELEEFDSPEGYDEFKKGFFSPENKKYMNYVQQMEDKYHTRNFEKVLGSMTEREYNHHSKLLKNNPVYSTKAPINPLKVNADMTAAEVDKIGRHNLYGHWEEYREKFLGHATPVNFDELDSSLMYDTVKLGRYKDKDVVERIFTQVDDLSSQFYSPLQKMAWMDETRSALDSAFATSWHGWGYGSAEMQFNPRKLTPKGIERLSELAEKGYSIRYPKGKEVEYLVTHEFGHCILNIGESLPSKAKNFVQCDFTAVKKARKEIDVIWNAYNSRVNELTVAHKAIAKPLDARLIFEGIPPTAEEKKRLADARIELESTKISAYSLTNPDEFVAEAFADVVMGENPSEYSKQVYDVILKYFGKD